MDSHICSRSSHLYLLIYLFLAPSFSPFLLSFSLSPSVSLTHTECVCVCVMKTDYLTYTPILLTSITLLWLWAIYRSHGPSAPTPRPTSHAPRPTQLCSAPLHIYVFSGPCLPNTTSFQHSCALSISTSILLPKSVYLDDLLNIETVSKNVNQESVNHK